MQDNPGSQLVSTNALEEYNPTHSGNEALNREHADRSCHWNHPTTFSLVCRTSQKAVDVLLRQKFRNKFVNCTFSLQSTATSVRSPSIAIISSRNSLEGNFSRIPKNLVTRWESNLFYVNGGSINDKRGDKITINVLDDSKWSDGNQKTCLSPGNDSNVNKMWDRTHVYATHVFNSRQKLSEKTYHLHQHTIFAVKFTHNHCFYVQKQWGRVSLAGCQNDKNGQKLSEVMIIINDHIEIQETQVVHNGQFLWEVSIRRVANDRRKLGSENWSTDTEREFSVYSFVLGKDGRWPPGTYQRQETTDENTTKRCHPHKLCPINRQTQIMKLQANGSWEEVGNELH